MAKQQDTTLATLTHLLTLISSFIAPLIILLVAEDSFSRNHARSALNWQLSLLVYFLSSVILGVAFFFVFPLLLLLFIPLAFFFVILDLVLVIIAAVKASENKLYVYPLSITFLKQE
ncbi:MAG: DUF4870 domain-containing protein [Candidatus Woesearchaeota archaeon]